MRVENENEKEDRDDGNEGMRGDEWMGDACIWEANAPHCHLEVGVRSIHETKCETNEEDVEYVKVWNV